MKKTIVRSSIVAFGLLCVGIVVLIIFNIGEYDPYKELDSLSARIDAKPKPEHLRDLLNYPADGAYSYYQMALTGAAFSKHPEVLRAVSQDLQTDRERSRVKLLATLGARVFEYHPELKPDEFDQRIREQSWLTQTLGEQDASGNRR